MLYTSANGHRLTYFSLESVLGICLSKEDQEAFGAKYNTPPFVQYGTVMRGCVTVPYCAAAKHGRTQTTPRS
jgi:hypothetical protein